MGTRHTTLVNLHRGRIGRLSESGRDRGPDRSVRERESVLEQEELVGSIGCETLRWRVCEELEPPKSHGNCILRVAHYLNLWNSISSFEAQVWMNSSRSLREIPIGEPVGCGVPAAAPGVQPIPGCCIGEEEHQIRWEQCDLEWIKPRVWKVLRELARHPWFRDQILGRELTRLIYFLEPILFFRSWWVRPIETWIPVRGTPSKEMGSLIAHLLFMHPVSEWLMERFIWEAELRTNCENRFGFCEDDECSRPCPNLNLDFWHPVVALGRFGHL